MKKILIVALVAGGLYFAFGRKPKTAEVTEIPESDGENDIFTKYNNKVIYDKDGYWMLVKDGKLFTTPTLETLQAWQALNPESGDPVEVQSSVWLTYNATNYGGTF